MRRAHDSSSSFARPSRRLNVRTTFVPLAYGRQLGAGAGEVDDRLLLVQRALLGGEVEAGEDDDAVEAVRPALACATVTRERRAPVRPHARLDRVEHVREPYRLAAAHDLDVDRPRAREAGP